MGGAGISLQPRAWQSWAPCIFQGLASNSQETVRGDWPLPLALGPPVSPSHFLALEQWLCPAVSAQDGHTICSHKPACGGIVTPCQVVEVLPVLVFLAASQLLIVFAFHHLAFVRNGLDIILILMARLVQRIL